MTEVNDTSHQNDNEILKLKATAARVIMHT